MIKFKLPKTSPPQNGAAGAPASATTTPSSSGIKIKLNNSQPPTPVDAPASSALPASGEKKKRAYTRKADGDGARGKKRAVDDDAVSPAAKRIQSGSGRKLSIKIGGPQPNAVGTVPGKIPLAKRKSTVPKILDIRARGRAPPRAKGLGYDSEDSETEKDPAIQQALVLRMAPGEDADYLRQAITDGKVGPHVSAGDADVSLKFVEKNYRRAVVRVRSNLYAAVLVDLPCVVETMKSFDRKGWYKVADCCQMLLVLGRCTNDEEARTFALPREITDTNFQYPHGLTAPLRNVRKRRWRHRPNHNDAMEAEEIAQALLEADRQVESTGGTCTVSTKKTQHQTQSVEPQDRDESDDEDAEADEDAEGEAVETVEGDGTQYEEYQDYEEDDDDGGELEAQLAEQMGLANSMEDALGAGVVESPVAMADDVGSIPPSAIASPTPEGTPAADLPSHDEPTSGDDESDEDEDDMDVFDEDAAAQSAERAQQMEEVADLEQEIARTRQKANAMTNQLLKQRELRKLAGLEEDLKAKRVIFGLEEE